MAFGLRIRGTREEDVRRQVQDMLKLVDLAGYEKRKVDSLSGGQKQRVAMARALILKPAVFLLDEPLGALDLKLRKEMQIELKQIQQQVGITFIYVTHDQEEALTMSDTIVVMNKGRIQQIGTPTDIYNEPKNAFVADFIGESNIIGGVMNEDFEVAFAGHTFRCLDKGFGRGEAVDVVVRPEDLHLAEPEEGQLRGVVESIVFKGVHYEMMVRSDSFTWMIQSTLSRQVGQTVGMNLTPDDIHIMRKGAGSAGS
ncbi:Spermidine/putrescine import ATP-binding protein PotA [bioreactor metagenome]|uniref:Spermidine/putrescine import ATP-binding protein PotA n=1 Tax=bioreactor metagenome TaxID=1076179 RepID=A0A645G3D5_9ZZZZ